MDAAFLLQPHRDRQRQPVPAECAAQGFTQILVATVTTDRFYCRDEDDSAGVGPISYVKCLDISHKSDTPGYVTIEVWFRYATP